ncbi:MAG: hypothetical protein EOO01_05870 [Chitinophagaceae bacterium]|nr:MAG: hypothetical protein EOO01_05870 [Chitinophagaceae bacterium]
MQQFLDLLHLTGGFFRQIWETNSNLTVVKRRVYDEAFKVMAIALPYEKGTIQDAARDLGIYPGRIRKWRQRHQKNEMCKVVKMTGLLAQCFRTRL